MAAISARKARVTIGGTNLLATKWTVEIKSDEIDVTNFESGGFADYMTTYVDAMVTVDAFYDPANNPHGDPPNILTGNILEDVELWTKTTIVAENFSFPLLLVLSCTVDAAVRDAVRISFTGRNKGPFVYPGSITFSGVDEDDL